MRRAAAAVRVTEEAVFAALFERRLWIEGDRLAAVAAFVSFELVPAFGLPSPL